MFSRSVTDLFYENRLTADYFYICKVCFQSVQVLPSSSGKMFDAADEKQMENRSAHDLLSLQSLQAVFSTHVHQFETTYY